MKYTEFIELAKANYTKGGDSYYECWDERTFNEYEEMFGKITEKEALQMFKENAEIEAEYEAAAEWFGGMDQETIDRINEENERYEASKKAEEDKEMAKAQVEVTVIEVEGVIYTQTRPGYYYKKVDGKQTRIPKAEWEQAFDAYMATVDEADEQEEADELTAAMEKLGYHRIQHEINPFAYSTCDGQSKVMLFDSVEEGMEWVKENTPKKVRKPRRSKDVAFEMDTIEGRITLTAKQVDFLKLLPTVTFWEEGIESTLWCDCIADDINWNPMSVGAMISTLREKGLVVVGRDTSRKGKPKYMSFTTVGQVIAKKLGLD